MSDDKQQLTNSEAIRQVIDEGSVADFIDVVNQVKKRFGLKVSSGMVEEVFLEMKQETESLHQAMEQQQVSESLAKAQARKSSPGSSTSAESDRGKVLQFVKEMGGFAAARNAIAELEELLKDLDK